MSDDDSRRIPNMSTLLAMQRDLTQEKDILPEDCLRIARDVKIAYWVSTPNMKWVPEVPRHSAVDTFHYFGDGMLGEHEHYKWAQGFNSDEPHAMAAPLHPSVMTNALNDADFFERSGLPCWEDYDLAFDGPGPEDFVSLSNALGANGKPSSACLERISKGMQEMVKWVQALSAKELSPEGVTSQTMVAQISHATAYLTQRCNALVHTVEKLSNPQPTTFFKFLMWWREYQRVLLELRAFINYYRVLKPRYDDPTSNYTNTPPLPFRGVITAASHLLRTAFRVGLPVWYVRGTDTLLMSTKIGEVVQSLDSGMCFERSRIMRYQGATQTAPAWYEVIHDDPTIGSVFQRIKKYSLTSRPLLYPMHDYDAKEATALYHTQSMRDFSAPGPGESTSTRTDVSTARGDLNLSDIENAFGEGGVSETKDKSDAMALYQNNVMSLPNVGHQVVGTHSHPQASAPAESTGIDLTRGDGTSSGHGRSSGLGSSKQQSVGQQSVRVQHPPQWFPIEDRPWAKAIDSLGNSVRDTHVMKQTFALPPYHIFSGPDDIGMARRLHSYLRIRGWCFDQVFDAPAHGQTKMTAAQWRVALEGGYYFVEYEHLDSRVQPIASKEDIARLPPRPDHDNRNANGKRERGEQITNQRLSKMDKRTRDRIDVNVRMHVHAGFAPYDEEEGVYWRGHLKKLADVRGDLSLYRSIMWELSVLHFRLEFLLLDELCYPYPTRPPTPSAIAHRQIFVTSIWGGGNLSVAEGDRLTSGEFGQRASAILRLGECMSPWGFPSLQSSQVAVIDGTHFRRREQDTIVFYVERFHQRFGRIPCIPLEKPLV